jgi:hypothetical protein
MPHLIFYSNCRLLRFVDRDMFMRYTHCGIGHPTAVRELVRDCANAELADNSSNLEESENDENEIIQRCDSDGEGSEGDEDEDDSEELNDHDPECQEMDMVVDEEDEDEDEDEDLSF